MIEMSWMRVAAILLSATALAGCKGTDSVVQRKASAKLLPVMAAYVRVGQASSNAARVGLPKWVSDKAGSQGLVVHAVGVWQELPESYEHGLLVTSRELVRCRVVERRKDGQVVVETSTHVSGVSKRITLAPGANQRAFIHLFGLDAVSVRLGWEGRIPPAIFARAVLVYGSASTRRGWAPDLPDWAFKWLAGSHAMGCEDLGTGTWIKLGPDPKSLGMTSDSGEIRAHIVQRDRNDWVAASAVLSGRKDKDGRPLRKTTTVQPVMPGNERPGTICSFQRSDAEGLYVAVVFHYGPVGDAKTPAHSTSTRPK